MGSRRSASRLRSRKRSRSSDNGSELRSNSASKWVARCEALRKECYIRGKNTPLKTLGVRCIGAAGPHKLEALEAYATSS